MSDKFPHTVHDESLSALMDGESQELELRRLLQCLPDDSELRAKWARYHAASSILHKDQYPPAFSLGFADAVQVAIQKEQSFGLNSRESENLLETDESWRKSAARFAVAASVALVVVTGVQWQQRMSATEHLAATIPATKNATKAASLESVTTAPLAGGKLLAAGMLMPAGDKPYERYMQYNLEHASIETGRGIVPLAPVAEKIHQEK